MNIDIFITIILTSVVQSFFGTGVLLFGTPILLILGKGFQTTLVILLPASILINFFQIRNSYKTIDRLFYKNLILISLPLICLSLYLSQSKEINANFLIGIFLIIISLQSKIGTIKRTLDWLLNYEKFYLAIMGVFHGLTNLGGSLLSVAILSQDLTKDSKRSTIAVSYCSMAVIQIITLIATLRFDIFLHKSYLLYWATAPTVFFIVEKYLYYSINEKLYKTISNVVLFLMGIIILIKT